MMGSVQEYDNCTWLSIKCLLFLMDYSLVIKWGRTFSSTENTNFGSFFSKWISDVEHKCPKNSQYWLLLKIYFNGVFTITGWKYIYFRSILICHILAIFKISKTAWKIHLALLEGITLGSCPCHSKDKELPLPDVWKYSSH